MANVDFIEKMREIPVNYRLANASKYDTNFTLFTNNLRDGVPLTETNIKTIEIRTNLPTLFLIHGWNTNYNSNWYHNCRDEYFKKGQYNIICVDWVTPGSLEYMVSAANVQPVGKSIGEFLVTAKFDLGTIHLVGTSLGSHVASWAGKYVKEMTGKKLKRITGLDPAAPQFEHDYVQENERLNKTDATFVDVIHTDAGYYGFRAPLGTVDYYPNGGCIQPGCDIDEDGHNSSHDLATWYFLEAINSTNVKAAKASTWEDFLKSNFNTDESIVFGEDTPTSAEGIFYLKTNPQKPFLIPDDEI